MADHWLCSSCGLAYPLDADRFVCDCPGSGRLELSIDYAATGAGRPMPDIVDSGEPGLWRYARLLPLPAGAAAADLVRAVFPAGGTPLHRLDRLAGEFGIARLWLKNEAANPTGSLKDRASAVAVAAAIHSGAKVVAAASTGNAAISLAGAAASCGLRCVVFLPASASVELTGRLAAYGAHALVVDGDYSAAVRLCAEACDTWGWWLRTSAVNPFTTQGKKTVALEIVEQFRGRAPGAVLVPVGDGNILTGVYQGFRDAFAMGWIDRIPRLVAVQAEGAPAVYRAWCASTAKVAPAPAHTVARGIQVDDPLDGERALAAVRVTGGTVVTVSDHAIMAAERLLARQAGVRADPAAAAAVAALPSLVADRSVDPADDIVLINTGVARGNPATTTQADRVAPRLAAVEAVLGGLSGV